MIEKLYPNGHRFIQDNDPKHKFAKAQEFFIDHGVNWWHTPPESPDCNPIESKWHEMKEHLRREVKPQRKKSSSREFSLFGKLLTVQNVTDTLITCQIFCLRWLSAKVDQADIDCDTITI